MTKGIPEQDADPRVVYADIIDLPHHRSQRHPHMSLYDRAAQFASYKALSGYEDMIAEEARLTERELRPEEHELELLNRKLRRIAERAAAGESPFVIFTVFVPDKAKEGGAYQEVADRVRQVDTAGRTVVLCSRRGKGGSYESIPFDRIVGIRGATGEDFTGAAGSEM